ncbi:MAG: OmpA family protein [Propioniciclava sp.]
MTRLRRGPLLIAGSIIALSGCTLATPPEPSPEVPATSTATPSPSSTSPAELATAIVREGATAPEVIATAPLVSPGLEGGTLHVYSVRSTENSTRLMYTITHPTAGDDKLDLLTSPTLQVDGTEYRVSQHTVGTGAWRGRVHPGFSTLLDVPRPLTAMFAPLPAGTSEVEVHSTLIERPLTVPLARGAEVPPDGTDSLPIRARVVYGDSAKASSPDPLIVTIHGVRRITGGTLIYYSTVFPEGATATNISTWGGGSRALKNYRHDVGSFARSFGIIDRQAMRGYTVPNLRNPPSCLTNYPRDRATQPTRALTCWTFLPPIDEDTDVVDVLVGGQMLVQDIPVETGLMEPTTEAKSVALGDGWPPFLASDLERFAPWIDRAIVQVRDVTTTGAITTSGTQIDLDTTVLFDYNQATLTPAADEILNKTAEKIRLTLPEGGNLTITGHTDSDGDERANQTLSEARAEAVAAALKRLLTSTFTFTVEGQGETDPVAENNTEEGKAQNRRVTIDPAA